MGAFDSSSLDADQVQWDSLLISDGGASDIFLLQGLHFKDFKDEATELHNGIGPLVVVEHGSWSAKYTVTVKLDVEASFEGFLLSDSCSACL